MAPAVRSLVLTVALCLGAGGGLGCSILTSYPSQTANARRAFQSLNAGAAAIDLADDVDASLDGLAYRLERGLVLHTDGRLDESTEAFFSAVEWVREQEGKAVISASDTAAQAGSLLVNEKTIPYRGEPFERVLLHAYLAMNFLFEGEAESARVEIRQLQDAQKALRARAEEEAEAVREEAAESDLASGPVEAAARRLYADQSSIASRVQNLYDDAFAYALSAAVYDLNDEPNDAFIDLRRAAALRPELRSLKADLYRAAVRSGLRSEARALAREHPWVKDVGGEGAELIVVFQSGDAPLKGEVGLAVPTGHGIVSVALPKYFPQPNPYGRAVVLDAAGRTLGTTELYTDVEALAIRTLQDRIGVLALKQAIRAVAKGVLAKQAEDELGLAGVLLASLYNVVTEQADLRGWTTLPAELQWARIPLAPGRHDLTLALESRGGGRLQSRPLSVELEPGQTRFVNVRTTGPAVYLNVYPRESPPPDPSPRDPAPQGEP